MSRSSPGSRLAKLDRAYAAASGSIGASLALQLVVTTGGVLAARMLGVTDRGHLATLWLIVLIPAQLGTLGLPGATTYFVAHDPTAARAIMRLLRRPATVQAVVLVVIQGAALVIILPSGPRSFVIAGLLTLAVLPPIVGFEYGLALLQGQQRFRTFNLMRILPNTAYSLGLAGAFLVDRQPGLIVVASFWVTATVVASLVCVAIAVAGLPAESSTAQAPPLAAMRRFGLKGVLGAATVLEQLQLDQAIVGLALTQTALGLYVTAVAFANLPRFIGLAIGMVAFPDVAGTTEPRKARRRLWRYVLIDAAACAAIGGMIELLVGRVLPAFFGQAFSAAVPVARILVISGVLQSIRRVLADGVRGLGHPGLATFAEVSSWVVLGPSLLLLVPSFDLEGVAYALVVAPAVAITVLMLGLVFQRPASGGRRPNLVPLIEASGVADATYVEGI